uniref:CX domain-containing protein n=1 Tax=Plectus sambesii TaxID=2011161 RepID=A0A914WIK2_9BILA
MVHLVIFIKSSLKLTLNLCGMQLSAWTSALLVIILVVDVDVIESKDDSGGGGRGDSDVRGNSAGRSKGTGSSFSNREDGSSTFSNGTGLGSAARRSSFKSAIADAAADYIAYQGGKAIIKAPEAAMTWNNRRYYWGSSCYQYRLGHEMCSISLINSTDDTFSDVVFDNGTGPEMIAWSCHASSEYCCGYECCPKGNDGFSFWAIIGLFVGAVLLLPVLLWCILYVWLSVEDCISGCEEGKGKNVEEYSEQALMESQIIEIQSDQALRNVQQVGPLQPQYPQ